jgi:hypothetical protein
MENVRDRKSFHDIIFLQRLEELGSIESILTFVTKKVTRKPPTTKALPSSVQCKIRGFLSRWYRSYQQVQLVEEQGALSLMDRLALELQ